MTHDLVVVGDSLAALSVASQARRAGVAAVVVVTTRSLERISADRLVVEQVGAIEVVASAGDVIELVTSEGTIRTRGVVLDLTGPDDEADTPWPIPGEVAHLFHRQVDFDAEEKDVLVVGRGESAIPTALRLIEGRARVVLALDGESTGLSVLARQTLERLEREQAATVLWRSFPRTVGAVAGFPMIGFGDRRTPDLQFDHVVMALASESPASPFPVELAEHHQDRLFVITETGFTRAPVST